MNPDSELPSNQMEMKEIDEIYLEVERDTCKLQASQPLGGPFNRTAECFLSTWLEWEAWWLSEQELLKRILTCSDSLR